MFLKEMCVVLKASYQAKNYLSRKSRERQRETWPLLAFLEALIY
jgi:hypothetical protein